MAPTKTDPIRRLPPELWSKICSYLDRRDAANLRLSCRTLDAIGAYFILRELTVYLDPAAFALLRAVASDPVKARCIRSLVYAPGAFYPLEQPDVKVGNYVPLGSGLLTPAQLQAHDRYRTACRDQARLLSLDLDYELLAAALPRLTGLRKLIIHCEVGRPEQTTVRKGGISSGVGALSRAWCQTSQHPHTQHGRPGRRALASLLRALESTGTALPSLKALGLDWESLANLSWATTRPGLRPFFDSLRKLNLQICLCRVFRRDSSSSSSWSNTPGAGPDRDVNGDMQRYAKLLAESGALAGFLGACSNLAALGISFCFGLSAGTGTGVVLPGLEHVLCANSGADTGSPGEEGHGEKEKKGRQHPVWPRLESISLGGLNLRKSLLMHFLQSHKATLRRVELFSVWLDAEWPDLLKEMRGMLTLEDAAVWTRISSDRGQWHLGQPSTRDGPRGEPANLATAIGRYLVHGGLCPVSEGNMAPGGASLVRGCYTRSLY